MCTLVILRRPERAWPVVIGANRDEMIGRPAMPPGRHWPDRMEVVAGLDLHAGERVLAGSQEVRDDAGDDAAVIEHGGCDRAHQAKRTAAIDQADVVLGEGFTERLGAFGEVGIRSRAGAAIDTDGFDRAHWLHDALQRRGVKPNR